MIEKISLRIFWAMMLTCASLGVLAIWLGEPSELHGRAMGTAFIIGVASFLIWAPLMVYRLYNAVNKNTQ